MLGTPFPETLDRCGHDRRHYRLEHRGGRSWDGACEGGYPSERRGSDLDGKISVGFALGIGYLEAAVVGVLLILSGGIRVHGTTLLPCTGSERQFAGAATVTCGRHAALAGREYR
jgi:hypothetical protein